MEYLDICEIDYYNFKFTKINKKYYLVKNDKL